MEEEPLVGGGVFADEGVGGGDAVVLVADGEPAGGFDGFELLGIDVEFDAGEGLDEGFELVGGEVEVGGDVPEAGGGVGAPCEDVGVVFGE